MTGRQPAWRVFFLAQTQDLQAASIIAAAWPGSGSSFAALAVAARALCAALTAALTC